MLEEKVYKTIKENSLIKKGDKVVIGVSGGPDSMALLHILYNLKEKLGFEICVAHVNHMLRKEADEETEFVKKYCKNLNIDCFAKKVDVKELAEKEKISTELAGRNIRYAFFEEIKKNTNANKIATAHHAGDNAETVLMNLLRGSGISGLKGIEKIRGGIYIRPLLEVTKAQIEQYCKENEIPYRQDKSNKENIYTRNKIRNELIPYLEKEFNPNIVETLNRLSDIAKKQEEYFSHFVENIWEEFVIEEDKDKIIINLKKFNDLEEIIKSKMILYAVFRLEGNTQNIEKIHIDDIIKLCSNNIGNKYLMPNKNFKVYVKKGKIYFLKVEQIE